MGNKEGEVKRKRKVVFTFRTSHKAALEELARKQDRTVSNIVNIAIREFLARHSPKS